MVPGAALDGGPGRRIVDDWLDRLKAAINSPTGSLTILLLGLLLRILSPLITSGLNLRKKKPKKGAQGV